jgi:hypothetical protein
MLKISPASSEAFFAFFPSLKGTCCKFSSNPWKCSCFRFWSFFACVFS